MVGKFNSRSYITHIRRNVENLHCYIFELCPDVLKTCNVSCKVIQYKVRTLSVLHGPVTAV
jgi:hypothetical protein